MLMLIDTFVQQAAIDSPLETLRERLDLIKISTEGNELAVLIGGKETISKFAQTIIYNRYTSKSVNLATAEYSIDRGYQLFRYQPYLQQLIPLVNEGDFDEVVKAIPLLLRQTLREQGGYANAIGQPNS